MTPHVDLVIDLNTMDDSGLPRAFLDAAPDRSRIISGTYIVVSPGSVRAAASVVDIDGDIVHVRPLRGPVEQHAHLLGAKAS